jgi:hypothetical protein
MLMQATFVNETKGWIFGESGWYEPYTTDLGRLFRDLRAEYGRCTGHVYIDTARGTDPPGVYSATRTVGWVFEKLCHYEDTGDPYLRVVWVSLNGRPGFDLDAVQRKQRARRAKRRTRRP